MDPLGQTIYLLVDGENEPVCWYADKPQADAEAERRNMLDATRDKYQAEYLDLPSRPGKWGDDFQPRLYTFEEWVELFGRKRDFSVITVIKGK